jgi:hypothetical protein
MSVWMNDHGSVACGGCGEYLSGVLLPTTQAELEEIYAGYGLHCDICGAVLVKRVDDEEDEVGL